MAHCCLSVQRNTTFTDIALHNNADTQTAEAETYLGPMVRGDFVGLQVATLPDVRLN